MNKKIILFIGTRPEAIKMLPLAIELKKIKSNQIIICSTGQHKELLNSVFKVFEIKPDIKLNIFDISKDYDTLLTNIYSSVSKIFRNLKPDLAMVHGDTANSMICALSAFNHKIKIAHVEAGLRSKNNKSPWPEEVYRKMISNMSDFHFCPTKLNYVNLLNEEINKKNILITGNTVIDAVQLIIKKTKKNKNFNKKYLSFKSLIGFNSNLNNIIVTIHRREKYGDNINHFCEEIKKLAKLDVKIFITIHHNPNIKKPLIKYLQNVKNINLIPPVDYDLFINLLNESFFVISDSGGIQEELTFIGKPLIVIRDNTERIEAVHKSKSIMVGDNSNKLIEVSELLINSKSYYAKYSKVKQLYGIGNASSKISDFIKKI